MDSVETSFTEIPPAAIELIKELKLKHPEEAANFSIEGRRLKPLALIQIVDTEKKACLLGHKARGFGANKWNGFGGKVDPEHDKCVRDAAVRELQEECGIEAIPEQMRRCGVLFFVYPEELTHTVLEVHVFEIDRRDTKGEATESEEMTPIKYFPFEEIPLDKMWADDEFWLPELSARWREKGTLGRPNSSDADIQGFIGLFDFVGYESVRCAVVKSCSLDFPGVKSDVQTLPHAS